MSVAWYLEFRLALKMRFHVTAPDARRILSGSWPAGRICFLKLHLDIPCVRIRLGIMKVDPRAFFRLESKGQIIAMLCCRNPAEFFLGHRLPVCARGTTAAGLDFVSCDSGSGAIDLSEQ